MRALSAVGTSLIQRFEQLVLHSYQDQKGIWTIAWGHTGKGIGPNMMCTIDQATAWFQADTAAACAAVNHSIDVPMTQNQFDALVSFTFNVGVGAEESSTLCRLVNEGNTTAAATEFIKWDHIEGVPNAGLLRRRQAEQVLFLS